MLSSRLTDCRLLPCVLVLATPPCLTWSWSQMLLGPVNETTSLLFYIQTLGPPGCFCSVCCSQCLFLLWCMAPMSWNGSQIIYDKVVRPIFLRHEAMVDNMVSNLGGRAMEAAENLTREGAERFSTTPCAQKSKYFKQCSLVPSLQS